MKLGPVTKCDNVKKIDDDVMFGLLTFLSIATFYLTKTENRTTKSLTQLSDYCYG